MRMLKKLHANLASLSMIWSVENKALSFFKRINTHKHTNTHPCTHRGGIVKEWTQHMQMWRSRSRKTNGCDGTVRRGGNPPVYRTAVSRAKAPTLDTQEK